MSAAQDITAPLLELIRAELASGRTSISRLAHITGVSRGTIYATLDGRSANGALGVLSRLADALGADVTLVVTPGVGPAHLTPKPTVPPAAPVRVDVPSHVPNTEAEPPAAASVSAPAPTKPKSRRQLRPKKPKRSRPIILRWRSDEVMNRAWLKHAGDVVTIANSLRMNIWACRQRYLVMGHLLPHSTREAVRLAVHRTMAEARCAGCSISEVAARAQVSPQAAKVALRMLSISGHRRAAREPSPVAQT